MNSDERLALYQAYIRQVTNSANSWEHYSQFSRIDRAIKSIHPDYKDLIEYDDADFVQRLYDELLSLPELPFEKGVAFKRLGQGQYHNAVLTYVQFLKACRFFGDKNLQCPKPFVNRKNISLQQIFYGAPGTGKSHRIEDMVSKMSKENVFRTTFHPDTDYSTFVGCYKPTKEKNNITSQTIVDYSTLIDILRQRVNTPAANITKECVAFGYEYHDSLVKMQMDSSHTIPSLIIDAYKPGSTYDTQVRAGMAVFESFGTAICSSDTITYSFVPQVFLKAYIRAYQTTEPVILVIEEINRGNCAQIFGDLFQLLDRNNEGSSEYPIKADDDICEYLKTLLGSDSKAIANDELCLPPNLYIWATMNTSDQSLFPIDSAFKRRWDWKYIPINTQKEKWNISVNGTLYSWSSFLDKINYEIGEQTSSEDKKLGFYFCKSENNIISAERFVSKVLFYIYNDVFKDYEFDRDFFKRKDNNKLITFQNLYDCHSGNVNEVVVAELLENLGVDKVEGETIANEDNH